MTPNFFNKYHGTFARNIIQCNNGFNMYPMSEEELMSSNVKSPCVGVCCLDEQDLCIACKRSGMEIAEWGIYSQEEKKAVLIKVEQRYFEAEI